MHAQSRNRRVMAIVVLILIGAGFYFLAGGLMDWLRVTMHGR